MTIIDMTISVALGVFIALSAHQQLDLLYYKIRNYYLDKKYQEEKRNE